MCIQADTLQSGAPCSLLSGAPRSLGQRPFSRVSDRDEPVNMQDEDRTCHDATSLRGLVMPR